MNKPYKYKDSFYFFNHDIFNDMFYLTIDFYKYVHYFLFKDVYKFAGKFREVNISKSEAILNGDTVVYCDYN